MAFNWFRRQFNKPAKPADDVPAADEQSDELEPAAPESDEAASPEPAPAEDYLSWAKTAYQNIQQRQKEPAPVDDQLDDAGASEATLEETLPEAPPEPELELEQSLDLPPASSESAASEVTAEPASQTQTAEIKLDGEEPESQDISSKEEVALESSPEVSMPAQSIAAAQVSQETDITPAAPSESIESETESEIESETVAPTIPFWDRGTADRQERLERLKETAIEEAIEQEPQPVAASTASEPGPAPELNFDEGFLWSAEVLAAQGRRPEEISLEEITWLKRLRQGLGKTRRSLVNQLKAIVGQGPLNQDAVMAIETLLLQADVGVQATDTIIEALQNKLREAALPPEAAIADLKKILRDILDQPLQDAYSPIFTPEKDTLNIWLITGVNGAGKTTTIGKITHVATESGYQCLIAAADTFRAAAVEQIKIWGQRSGVEVVANPGQNTDPASVVFDAIGAAQSRQVELLLVDTAGRLQNKQNLMDELKKIRRIIDKKAPGAKVESLLVLDATLGQNGLRQAQVFADVAQLTGVVLTKLDGTAKGGVALAVVQQLGLPIRFIGAGEGIADLRPFSSYEFVEALLSG